MFDPEVVQDIISNIIVAIERIERRFTNIDQPDDFVIDDDGIDRLDGITMMLIAIGEQIKRLDELLEFGLDERYPEVDRRGVKGTRDFLSHHYFIVDAEIIFDVCKYKLAGLKLAVLDMQTSVQP